MVEPRQCLFVSCQHGVGLQVLLSVHNMHSLWVCWILLPLCKSIKLVLTGKRKVEIHENLAALPITDIGTYIKMYTCPFNIVVNYNIHSFIPALRFEERKSTAAFKIKTVV